MTIYEKLGSIQLEIKVPKDQNNDFAGFKYRSAEDILEKLKPLLSPHKVTIILSDDVTELAGQVYVKANATLIDLESDGKVVVCAYAREEKTRPKMSEGQLTGAASSYARKYALNGLLLLDDNKDPDSQNNNIEKPKTFKKPAGTFTTLSQWNTINGKLKEIGFNTKEEVFNYLKTEYGVIDPSKMTKDDASMVISDLTNEVTND